jgi:hypothetical protein
MPEVDQGVAKLQMEGWEYVELTQSMNGAGIFVVLVVRREKG